MSVAWLFPTSIEEALELRAEHGDDATPIAGGTFLAILMNEGLFTPERFLSLRDVAGLGEIRADGELELGAMTTHRAVERSAEVRAGWPALADAFSRVASPRVRNQATVGGVLADADYASDPPAMLAALGARAVVRSVDSEREIPISELITGHYETSLDERELIAAVRVPGGADRAVYRKFRSRSTEDRPCVAVAAVRAGGELRVVVGAVAGSPQHFPDVCSIAGAGSPAPAAATEIGRIYAERIEPISDARGSAAYRRRVIAVEVRRAVEEVLAA